MASSSSRGNPDDEYEANLEAPLSHSCSKKVYGYFDDQESIFPKYPMTGFYGIEPYIWRKFMVNVDTYII